MRPLSANYCYIDLPDRSHERVDEELVFLDGSLFARVPHLAVASLHEPPFEVDRVGNVWIRRERVCGERKRLKRRVEVGDAVLCQQANEIESADRIFARRGREDRAEAM